MKFLQISDPKQAYKFTIHLNNEVEDTARDCLLSLVSRVLIQFLVRRARISTPLEAYVVQDGLVSVQNAYKRLGTQHQRKQDRSSFFQS